MTSHEEIDRWIATQSEQPLVVSTVDVRRALRALGWAVDLLGQYADPAVEYEKRLLAILNGTEGEAE